SLERTRYATCKHYLCYKFNIRVSACFITTRMGLFEKDFSQIPCFRQTFMYSISTGLGAGIVYFLLTSKIRQATHFGVGSYAIVTLGYWAYCRYNFSKEKQRTGQLRKALQHQVAYEGTELESKVKGQ
ncbi:hypothetical protein SK128_025562, partial [Halocaridina rubra]